jgi:hypothetical protein
MKKTLLAGVAVLLLGTAAHAVTLPKQMLGKWCSSYRDYLERSDPCENTGVEITRNWFHEGDGTCYFKNVKRLPNGSYFVHSTCYMHDIIFQIEHDRLRMVDLTIYEPPTPLPPTRPQEGPPIPVPSNVKILKVRPVDTIVGGSVKPLPPKYQLSPKELREIEKGLRQ